MNSLFKKILFLWTLLFSNYLFADPTDIPIHISNPTVKESEGTITFIISLDQAPLSVLGMNVSYQTRNGTAIAGRDYEEKDGGIFDFLYFAEGVKSRELTLDIYDDNLYEGDLRFYVDISTSAKGYQSASSGRGTILDDEPEPLSVSVYGKSIEETDSNFNTTFRFKLNQNAPAGGVTVNYKTNNGSAKAGEDYVAKEDSITFNEGEREKTVEIEIKGDLTPEEPTDEYFTMTIKSTSVGEIKTNNAHCNISDDDTIEVDIDSSDEDEGNIGDSNQLKFKIFLTKDYPLNSELIIKYHTEDGSDPAATEGSDYRSKEGSVKFIKGEREKFVYVDIIGDTEIEDDERVRMVISNSDFIIDHDSTAKILNDDGSFPGISFTKNEFTIIEGNSSQTFLDFNFTLSKPALADSSFIYDTWDGSAEDESKNNDYIWTHGEYNLTTGATEFSISVPINGDTEKEEDEYFYFGIDHLKKLKLSDSDEAIGTIINDDGSYPKISIDDVSILEGDSGTKTMTFTVNLDKPAGTGVTFDYKVFEGDNSNSLYNAQKETDYIDDIKTTVVLEGNTTSTTISITINGDTKVEEDEKFFILLSNPKDAKIVKKRGIGTIINDDSPHIIENIGEYRFDDCGNDEWKKDYSSIANHAEGTTSIIENDAKSYMCNSLNGFNKDLIISHNQAYELTEGTLSIMLYDHHNTWNSWLMKKGSFEIDVKRVDNNPYKGTISVNIGDNKIETDEIYFTSTSENDGDHDTQWIVPTFTFGKDGMKLYINGELKGSNPYTGGIKSIKDDIKMTNISGYFDEFYIFKGQMNGKEAINLYNNIIENKNIDGSLRNCGCENEDSPFTCDSSMYLSSSIKRGTGETGKMWLHKIDTTKNPFTFDVIEDEGETQLYNALAYSDAGDKNSTDFIFGLYKDQLIKIGKTGKAINLGKIDALSELLRDRQFFAGAAYGGYYYISGPGVDYEKIFKINLSDKTVKEITLNKAISLLDFSFSPDGKYLHGVIDGGEFVKINMEDGNVTKIGSPHIGYQFDSTFSDKTGRFFANDSKGNGFFEFDLNTGKKLFLSNSQKASLNDGANCLKAALLFTDYGDAPESYGEPRHNIANGIFMGENVDHDIKSFHSLNADGDDTNGTDDEDGITLADGSDLNGTYFTLDEVQTLKVTLSKEAYLRIWLDTDINGHFDNSTDLIYASNDKLIAGVHTIDFTLSATLSSNKLTYLRARVSSNPSKNPTGLMIDGEVEDYAVKLGKKFKGTPGTFNIERIGSHTLPINSNERNAWYTQIVGKDFDYHVVFYDENITKEQELINVPIKVELIDLNKVEGNNTVAPPHYDYFSSLSTHKSRILVTTPTYDQDLKDTLATKETLFRVLYPAYSDGSVRPYVCDEGVTAEECYIKATTPKADDPSLIKYAYAKDKFAIRPDMIHLTIADKNITHLNSRVDKEITLAAGYNDYNLTVIATQYLDDTSSKGYTKLADSSIDFNATGLTCNDTSSISEPINFIDGQFQDLSFKHDNVGEYLLKIEDDKSWTEVDQNSTILGCIPNSGEHVANEDGKVGCDIIVDKFDTKITFRPYRFAINMLPNNLPSNIHNDFIYMSDLSSSYANTAIQFAGNIIAQTEDNQTTKNFTSGCFAQDITLIPNALLESEDGNITFPNKILTANYDDNLTRKEVKISRMERFNNEDINVSTVDKIDYITETLIITKDKFLNDANGTLELDLRYNIQKTLNQPINPIQVTFNSLNIEAPLAHSETNGTTNFIPTGLRGLGNMVENFYFTQVAPDLTHYPRVNFQLTKTVATPLSVDIFCNAPEAYCTKTGIMNNTNLESSPRKQRGWVLSINHDQNNDGNVTGLTPDKGNVNTPPTPIDFPNGRDSTPVTGITGCPNPTLTKITIQTDPALRYNPQGNAPFYTVECTPTDPSEWTGIGNTGNIIDVKANAHGTGKMDW